jgi:peptidoglycan-associated lipoprotein
MKLKNLLNLMVLGSALTITAVGCKTHPGYLTPIPGERVKPNDQAIDTAPRFPNNDNGTGINTQPTTTGIPPTAGHPGYTADPSDPLKAETIHFDFDKSSVKSSEQPKLENIASYMKSHPDDALRIEGNCDERGTEEYNRALGERRALAAREYLVKLGIDASKIDTISYGQDKPVESGRNESAYAKNRRDDFVVLLPPKP